MSKFFTVTPEAATTAIAPFDCAPALHHREQESRSSLCSRARPPRSKVCELVDWEHARGVWERMIRPVNWSGTRQLRSCLQISWFIHGQRHDFYYLFQRVSPVFQLPRGPHGLIPQALGFIMNAPEFEKTEEGRAFLGGLLGMVGPDF